MIKTNLPGRFPETRLLLFGLTTLRYCKKLPISSPAEVVPPFNDWVHLFRNTLFTQGCLFELRSDYNFKLNVNYSFLSINDFTSF